MSDLNLCGCVYFRKREVKKETKEKYRIELVYTEEGYEIKNGNAGSLLSLYVLLYILQTIL